MSTFSPLCTDIVDFGTKNSNQRTEKITKITIHHMAGVSTGKNCATAHKNGNVASANYYVGNGGDICGGVSEDRRAWTSSSPWNDQRAITIECSNSFVGDPWPVSDAAYNSTIKLCADICTRYGITPHYTGTKDGSLTLHCFYAATACPGPTWKDYHTSGKVERDIITAMNKRPTPSPEPQNDEERIWNFLLAKIGNEYGVAGMMGNLQAESGLRPNNLQNTFEKSLSMTDEQYTVAVDIGAYTNFAGDKAGYGLAQWTSEGRKRGLLGLAQTRSKSIGDINIQLEWLWAELSGAYIGVLNGIKAAKSIREASDIVLTRFECPADQSERAKQNRAAIGEQLYAQYGQGNTNPYPVPSRLVKYNSQGDDVRWVQFQLNRWGAYLVIDGIFGNKTLEAVKAFQADRGLDIDGIVGPITSVELAKIA